MFASDEGCGAYEALGEQGRLCAVRLWPLAVVVVAVVEEFAAANPA